MERKKLYIIAGEDSGDLLGARLVAVLNSRSNFTYEIKGVGGKSMEAHGVVSLFPMQEIALMGVWEILPHLSRLVGRINQTVNDIRLFQPDILITIDSPGFNLAVVKKLGKTDYPKVHYVAPTVWAWKKWRVKKFKRYFDHLLALLPFEPIYFENVGLPCHFVGHPILESGADKGVHSRFRSRYDIKMNTKILLVLPGSRRGEIDRLLPIFMKSLSLIERQFVGKIVVVTTPTMQKVMADRLRPWAADIILIDDQQDKYDAMSAATLAIAASGTVALELAMAGTPSVIAYKISPLTYFLIRGLIKVKFVHLLNIMANQAIVPEYIQKKCKPEILADALIAFLTRKQSDQIEKLRPYLEQLRSPTGGEPSAGAADVIEKILK